MKLAIDAMPLLSDSRHRGIGRYALNLLAAMSQQAAEHDLVVLLDALDATRISEARQALRRAGVRAATATFDYPLGAQPTDCIDVYRDAAGLLKSRLVESLAPDWLLVTSFLEFGEWRTNDFDWEIIEHIPKAVVAYDLIPLLFPEHYYRPGEFLHSWYRDKLERFKQFDLFLAISEATRRDLIEHLGIAPERIRVIGAGLDDSMGFRRRQLHGEPENKLRALGIDRPFVLMVGNADWHKNSIGALEAFAALPAAVREQHQLVFTRVRQDVLHALDDRFQHLRGNVVIAGSVDEKTLAVLYRHCKLFFYPSLYEGFGLPVLEAMAWGAPVLSSSLSSLPEVVHSPAMLFDPRDPLGASAVLERALSEEAFRNSLLDGAVEHAHSFAWSKPARLAWEALRTDGRHSNVGHTIGMRRPWRRNVAAVACLAEVAASLDTDDGLNKMRAALECIARGERRRILVDISHVYETGARTGIQRVVRSYCAGLIRLARQCGDFDVEAVAWTGEGFIHPRRFAREDFGVDYPGEDEAVVPARNDLLFMLDSSWGQPERFDPFCQTIRALGGEVVWMVYDLVPVHFAQYCHSGVPPYFRNWLTHAVNQADGFICISETTRTDLEGFAELTLPQGRQRPWTRSVHLGADLEIGRMQRPGAAVSAVASADGALFVMIGTIEPRKDYATALAAFEHLWQLGVEASLVLVGKQGWNVDELSERIRSHGQYGKKLHWFEKASDGDIRCLLMRAKALLQTSAAEGFGLPVVEAGCLGVPLIISDIPAFREIAGDAAAYFPVGDAAALADVVQEGLAGRGFHRPLDITCLTWKQSTEKLANELLGRQPRRILVDISEVIRLNAWSGVQRVTRNFTVGLARLAHRLGVFSVEPFAWTEQGIHYAREFARTRLGIDCPGQDAPLEIKSGDVIFMLDSSWWSPERFDDLHRRAREKGGSIVWFVYDLIPIRYPQTCDPGMPPAFRAWMDHALSTADGFICDSEATRLDLEAYMDETLLRNQMRPWTGSVHLGSDLESGRSETPSPQTVDLAEQQRPMFVSVGTLEPRKDQVTILDAFEILWADGVDASLVLIGKQGWRTDALAIRLRGHSEYGKRLHWLEHATDGDMRHWLGRATALVQASIAEGFGLPLVEAGSLGVPLIVSDIAVFREIAANEAVYFPAGDVSALAEILRQAIASRDLSSPEKIVCLSWAQSSAKLAEWLMA